MSGGFVFLNGEFVPEERAVVSVFDRGFLYGDGLFETLRVANGRPFRWGLHWERLERGLGVLKLGLPFAGRELESAALKLASMNGILDGVLRLGVSRGRGARGYSPRGAGPPTVVMVLSPGATPSPTGPVEWRLATVSHRLPAGGAVAGFKNANKLLQVLARMEAEELGADEALLLDSEGRVAEGASGNIWWIEGSTLCTPSIDYGILPGIARATVQEIGAASGLAWSDKAAPVSALRGAAGVFLSMSSLGLVEVVSLDGIPLARSPLTRRLWNDYQALVASETRGAG